MFIDLVIIILISLAIFYCWMIDRQLRRYKFNREEIYRMTEQQSIISADIQDEIHTLSDKRKELNQELASIIRKAESLLSKLSVITEHKLDSNTSSELSAGQQHNDSREEYVYEPDTAHRKLQDNQNSDVPKHTTYGNYYETLKRIKLR